MVGFLAVDSNLHFFSLENGRIPKEYVVSDLDGENQLVFGISSFKLANFVYRSVLPVKRRPLSKFNAK